MQTRHYMKALPGSAGQFAWEVSVSASLLPAGGYQSGAGWTHDVVYHMPSYRNALRAAGCL